MASRSSKEEIDFRRLMERCMNLGEKINQSPYQTSKFQAYLVSLKAQLKNLENPKLEISKDVLAEYERKLKFLNDLLVEDKMIAPIEKTLRQSRFPLIDDYNLNSARQENDLERFNQATRERQIELKVEKQLQDELRSELFQRTKKSEDPTNHREELLSRSNNANYLTSASVAATSSSTSITSFESNELRRRAQSSETSLDEKTAITILSNHRQQQEALTEEAIKLTSILKEKVKQMAEIVKKDDKVIDETEVVMTSGLDKLKKERTRLQAFSKQIRSGTCTTWLILILVCLVFIATFVFMKLFSVKK